jgi:hypothetical protein
MIENELLPVERPLREAVRIYAKRLGIFFLIAVANVAVFALVVWIPELPTPLLLFSVTINVIAILFFVLESRRPNGYSCSIRVSYLLIGIALNITFLILIIWAIPHR